MMMMMMMMMKVTFFYSKELCHILSLATQAVVVCDKNDKNDFKKKKEFFNNKLETKKQTKQKVTRDA